MKKSSFVIGKSNMTFTKKGIKIQSPKVIIQGDVIQERKEESEWIKKRQ